MTKFCYNVNTIRIQTDVYSIFGNMQGKYNKRNYLIKVSNETIPEKKLKN